MAKKFTLYKRFQTVVLRFLKQQVFILFKLICFRVWGGNLIISVLALNLLKSPTLNKEQKDENQAEGEVVEGEQKDANEK